MANYEDVLKAARALIATIEYVDDDEASVDAEKALDLERVVANFEKDSDA